MLSPLKHTLHFQGFGWQHQSCQRLLTHQPYTPAEHGVKGGGVCISESAVEFVVSTAMCDCC
jgi:hypothetical protein